MILDKENLMSKPALDLDNSNRIVVVVKCSFEP